MIRGLLDAETIRYFVLNDYFGSMRVGPQIDLVNKKTIMVAPEDHDRAKEIITDFLQCNAEPEGVDQQYSFWEKLRMVIEALVLPGLYRAGSAPKVTDPHAHSCAGLMESFFIRS
jgi:hypothetical protein